MSQAQAQRLIWDEQPGSTRGDASHEPEGRSALIAVAGSSSLAVELLPLDIVTLVVQLAPRT